MFKPIYALALLSLCSPALAQGEPVQRQQEASTTQAQAKPDGKRMICQDEDVIGSRVATKRVCMTADQWRLQEQDDKNQTDMQQRTGPHL